MCVFTPSYASETILFRMLFKLFVMLQVLMLFFLMDHDHLPNSESFWCFCSNSTSSCCRRCWQRHNFEITFKAFLCGEWMEWNESWERILNDYSCLKLRFDTSLFIERVKISSQMEMGRSVILTNLNSNMWMT